MAGLLALDQVPPWRQASSIDEVRQIAGLLRCSGLELKRNRSAIEAQTQAMREANEALQAQVADRNAELNISRARKKVWNWWSTWVTSWPAGCAGT